MSSKSTELCQGASNAGLIPIVVGVTGHRDIPEEDRIHLHAGLKNYLKVNFIDKYTHSPIIFLSALAEGADRIAAMAALEAGCKLGVYLPFPEAEYLLDFETSESKNEFRALLTRAEFVEVAPQSNGVSSSDRVQGYVSVGIAIARHSQCLFALWDGLPSDKPGGTADVIKMYRSGIPLSRPMPEDAISNPETGPVIHFLTRRTSNLDAVPIEKLGQDSFLPPQPVGSAEPPVAAMIEKNRWNKVFDCIEQFNKDTSGYLPPAGTHPYSQGGLIEDRNLASQWPTGDSMAPHIAQVYAAANFVSMQSQKNRLTGFKQIMGLALLAIFFEQLYSGPFAFPLLLAVSITLALTATWNYRRLTRLRLEEKFLDYRALAEAARVNFFWHVSGLQESAADHYLCDQRDELEWLRQAIRTLSLPGRESALQSVGSTGIDLARQAWIQNQLAYFSKKAPKEARAAEMLSTHAGFWFLSGIAMIILTLVFHSWVNLQGIQVNELVVPSLTVVYSLAFTLSGLIKIYGNIMAHQEQAKRFRKMGIYFGLCEAQLRQAIEKNDFAAAKQLLLSIGRQALAENAEWLLLHRERPVEVPL